MCKERELVLNNPNHYTGSQKLYIDWWLPSLQHIKSLPGQPLEVNPTRISGEPVYFTAPHAGFRTTKRLPPLMGVPAQQHQRHQGPQKKRKLWAWIQNNRGEPLGVGWGARICVSQALDAHLRSRTTGSGNLMTILQMRTLNLSGDPERLADW